MKLNTHQIRNILVPFYQKACLDERVDMIEMTALLDYLRQTFEQNFAFEAWSNISLDKTKYDKEPYISYLADLKKEYFLQVGEYVVRNIIHLCETEKENSFDTWLMEYAHALVWSVDTIYDKLCNTDFSFTQNQKKKINEYKDLNEFTLDNKWAEAYPYFCELSGNNLFDKLIASNLKIIAGEIKLFWLPDYKNALMFFEEAKDLCPENARVERAMGEYFNRLGEFERAKNYYLSAIAMRPNDLDNYYGIGNTYRDEGNFNAAEQWYRDAINVNFMDSYSYSRIISLYNTPELINGKDNIIEQYIEKAKIATPDRPTGNSLYNFYRDAGIAYLSAQQYEKAIEYYKKADDLKPELTGAKIDIGYAYGNNKNYPEALSWFKKSLRADEGWNFDAHWAFAWLYELKGNETNDPEKKDQLVKQAIEEYKLCAGISKERADLCYNAAGNLYFTQRDYKEAIKFFDKAIEANPDEIVYYDNKRDALENSNPAPVEIEEILIATCKRFPENPEYHNRLGVFYYEQGDFIKAIASYTVAIEIDQSSSLYYENRGLAWQSASEFAKAEADFLQALQLNPAASIYNTLGVLYYRMKDYDRSIQNYNKAVELFDKEPVYFENIGLAYEKLNNDKGAISSFEKAISIEKEKGTFLNRLGLFYYKKGNNNQAVEYYKLALEKEPENVIYLKNLALAYEQLKLDDEAGLIYENLLKLDDSDEYTKVRIAIIKMRKNIYDDSVYSLLEQAIQKNPANLEYLEYMGYYYEKINMQDEALKIYRQALLIDDTDEYFNNRAGIILFNRNTANDTKEAILFYKKAIEKNKDFGIYWQNLALAYESLENYMEAEAAYIESVRLEPQNSEYLNFFGVFYNNKLLDYNKAIELYNEAIRINPNEAVYFNNLGYAYDLMNENEKANEAYAKAESLNSASLK